MLTKNYRPKSDLQLMSKILERLKENKVKLYVDTFLIPQICDFREDQSKQHALLRFVENFKKALDNRMSTGTISVDLCTAFDCLNYYQLLQSRYTASQDKL